MGVLRTASAAGLLTWAIMASSSLAQIKPPPDAPKSWIPERRAPDDGREAIVDLPLSEAEKREQAQQTAATAPIAEQLMMECVADASAARVMNTAPDSQTPQKASRAFAEPFTQARDLITARRYTEALPLLDEALPYAADPGQRLAVEQLRTAVHAGLNQQEDLILSLERQLATGVLPFSTIEAHCRTILGLRAQSGLLLQENEPGETPE